MSNKNYEIHPEAYYYSRNLSEILKNVKLPESKNADNNKQPETKNAAANKTVSNKKDTQIIDNTYKQPKTKNTEPNKSVPDKKDDFKNENSKRRKR